MTREADIATFSRRRQLFHDVLHAVATRIEIHTLYPDSLRSFGAAAARTE